MDEGRFKCVLVDAPLPRAAQLREYWRIGQKAGYEVYMSLPLETDPQVGSLNNFPSQCTQLCLAVAGLRQAGLEDAHRADARTSILCNRLRQVGFASVALLTVQVCFKRNVHNRSLDDIQKAAAAIEPPQPSFLQVSISVHLKNTTPEPLLWYDTVTISESPPSLVL